MSVLHVAHHGGHVVVELHRRAQRNAINAAMVSELHRVCADLEQHPQILIVTGAGTDFAAGADIAGLRERDRDDALAGINRAVFDRIAALPMPTIAAVEGWARTPRSATGSGRRNYSATRSPSANSAANPARAFIPGPPDRSHRNAQEFT